MKMTFYALFITVNLLLGSAAAKEQSMKELQIKIAEVSPSGCIVVEVSSTSEDPVKLWQGSNSWGAARWRVLRIRKGILQSFYQNPDRRFTRNIPSFNLIAERANIKQKLNLNGGNWCGFGYCSSHDEHGFGGKDIFFEPGDVVVVTYDVPRTNEAVEKGIWYGVSAAITIVP
jgi:hypothetical protein